MDVRIAVNFRSRSLKDFCPGPFGDAQDVDGPHDIGFDRLDGIELIVHGRGRAGKVVNFVHLQIDGIDDVVADQFEMRLSHQVGDVVFTAGKKIVQADHIMAFAQKAFTQMGA